MIAIDTVMSQIQRDNIFYRGVGTLEEVCKLQAEISFKAGIKEVVDYLDYVFINTNYITPEDIKPKLKEWGC